MTVTRHRHFPPLRHPNVNVIRQNIAVNTAECLTRTACPHLNFHSELHGSQSSQHKSRGPCSLTSRWLVRFTQGFPSSAAAFFVGRVPSTAQTVIFLPFLHDLPFANWAIIRSHASGPSGVLLAPGSVTLCLLPPLWIKRRNDTRALYHPRATSLCPRDVTVMRLDRYFHFWYTNGQIQTWIHF